MLKYEKSKKGCEIDNSFVLKNIFVGKFNR